MREIDTDRPVAHLPVTIDYNYDSYGAFYKVRVPQRIEARTDENGMLQLKLATWDQRIWLALGDRSTLLIYADTVKGGGDFTSSPVGRSGNTYNVRFRPL